MGAGEQQAHLSPCRRGHAGNTNATPPKASRESGEQRPTSPRQLAWGCRGCRLHWWEDEWEEAAKAAGGRVKSTYPFQDNLLIFEHPIAAVHLGRVRQCIMALCQSQGDLLFPSDS